MGFIPQCQHYMCDRGASLLSGTVVEVISLGPMGSKGDRLKEGLGSLQEQKECKWQQDCLGTTGAHLSAGMLHVLGVLGNHRTTGALAISSTEMGLSCRQHICFFCLGGRGGESKVEKNHKEPVFLIRILQLVFRKTFLATCCKVTL